jgi:PAS domain S-box-containing protein
MNNRTKGTFIKNHIITLAIGLAFLYWFLEAAIHVLIWGGESIAQAIFPRDPDELWMRGLICALFIGFGFYARHIINTQKRTQEFLAESEARYRSLAAQLSEARDRLVEKVRQQTADLSHTVDTLQEEVIARTQAEQELQKAYAQLEQRVAQRTAELRKLNESLEQEIAEHKKAEERLKMTNFSIDHAYAEFFWVGRDASIMFVNDYACKMLGYSREELLRMKVFDIDPNYPPERWPSHWQELKQRGTMTFESEHRTKDGRLIPVEVSINYLEYGGQEYNFANVHDITERRVAQNKIKNLAKIPAENPYPIIRIGWDGRVLYANEASEPYLADWRLQPDSIAPENIRKAMREAVESCSKQELELTHGSRAFSFVVAPIMDSYYCNLYASDITERKLAQEQLLRVNRALRVLSQCNEIMVRAREESAFLNDVCKSIIEYGGYRLVWVGFTNQSKDWIVRPVAHAGYDEGYLKAVTIRWDDSELGRVPAGVAVRTGRPSICANMLTDPAYAPWREEVAKRGYASSIAFPLIEGGITLGALSIYASKPDAFVPEEVDLLMELAGDMAYGINAIRTRLEREKAEAASERLNRELIRKNRELESIIFVASHDLRSALVNVQGFGRELGISCDALRTALSDRNVPMGLRERLKKPLEQDIPESVDFIVSSMAKIDALLTGLLRLSRLGRETMNIVRLDMNAVIAEIVRSMQFKILQANVRVEAGQLPPCMGDHMQIGQAFANLIDNSIKFLDKTRPGLISISGKEENNEAIYCVEDNGLGIAPEYQGKVFEIFQRLRPDEAAGEGLGLAIVRQIVERHNGRVWVESTLGQGSKFFILLPAVK